MQLPVEPGPLNGWYLIAIPILLLVSAALCCAVCMEDRRIAKRDPSRAYTARNLPASFRLLHYAPLVLNPISIFLFVVYGGLSTKFHAADNGTLRHLRAWALGIGCLGSCIGRSIAVQVNWPENKPRVLTVLTFMALSLACIVAGIAMVLHVEVKGVHSVGLVLTFTAVLLCHLLPFADLYLILDIFRKEGKMWKWLLLAVVHILALCGAGLAIVVRDYEQFLSILTASGCGGLIASDTLQVITTYYRSRPARGEEGRSFVQL